MENIDRKAVVFDMDGVILDSETLVLSCWEEIAQKYNILDIKTVCLNCMGINAKLTKELFLKQYGEEFPYDRYKQEVSQLFHKIVGEGKLSLMPGVLELLSYLKEQDYKIGLASSTREEIVKSELKQMGVLPYFDYIVCGDMVSRSKPDPEIFLTACEKLEVLPQDTYGIEDSYNGIRACHAAGMKAIMVPDKLPPTQEMKELSIVILDSLLDVLDYLKQAR